MRGAARNGDPARSSLERILIPMYSTCIFCHSRFGRNDLVEAWPVGRRLAFDAAQGRLWAICSRCGRWNLAPIKDRWQAVEACESQFVMARARHSTDDIGLARDDRGLDLVRIGSPTRRELAAWRYGRALRRRRVEMWALIPAAHRRSRLTRVDTGSDTIDIRRRDLANVRLRDVDGMPALDVHQHHGVATLRGPRALTAARAILPWVNRSGATAAEVDRAVAMIEDAQRPAWPQPPQVALQPAEGFSLTELRPEHRLAVEMAANEEIERRAIEGDLAALEREWRSAEEVARIADDLFTPSWIADRMRRAIRA